MFRLLDQALATPGMMTAIHGIEAAFSAESASTLNDLRASLAREGIAVDPEQDDPGFVSTLNGLQASHPEAYARALLQVPSFRDQAPTTALVGLAASVGNHASALTLADLSDRTQVLKQVCALLGVEPKAVQGRLGEATSGQQSKISFATGSLGEMPLLTEILQATLQDLPVKELLNYSDPAGLPRLREQIAQIHSAGRAEKLSTENILITTSAQQALDITFGKLAKKPRLLFVQQPAFFGIYRLLENYPELKVIPFEEPDEIREMVEKNPGAAVYISSNFHYARGSLSPAQKNNLAQWAREYDLTIVEDNPYDLLGFDDPNPLRIHELAPDHTIYISSFSKSLAPGLRLGYLIAPAHLKKSLKSAKIDRDLFTPTTDQLVALAATAPGARSYLNDLRAEMDARAKTALGLMEKHWSDLAGVSWTIPEGSLFINVSLPDSIDMEEFLLKAEAEFGIKLESDRFSYWDRQTRHTTRINFVQNASAAIMEEGILRFKQAVLALQNGEKSAPAVATTSEPFVPLDVVITSGGTITYIDTVRTVGNISGGKTGAVIAEEFLRRGHRVHFIHRKGSRLPFEDAFEMPRGNYTTDERATLEARMNALWREFRLHESRLNLIAYDDFDDYLAKVREWSSRAETDIVISAAAVSDYGAKPADHKIRSTHDTLDIELTKLPKVIANIKRGEKWNEHVFLVAFKLLTGVDMATLIDEAYRSGIVVGANLVLGNSAAPRDFGKRTSVIITPEKSVMPVARDDVAAELVTAITQRYSRRHYATAMTVNPDFATQYAREIAAFRDDVQRLWELNIFEPYLEGEKMDFGFYAKRLPDGSFLITARASDKEDLPVDDIVRVTHVDFTKRVVHAESLGKKASLNANVAAKIFAERTDIDVIMHTHVSPGFKNETEVDYAPGTQEDLDEVWHHLQNGTNTLELKGHGIIVLGDNVQNVIQQMTIEPAYTTRSPFYDLMYGRFQKENTADLIALVKRECATNAQILDLAGGTGDLTTALYREGFHHIALADRSPSMAGVARQKFTDQGLEIPVYEASMTDLSSLPFSPTGIVIRQAINYLMTREGLLAGFKAMFQALQPGGKLIFNAPHFQPDRLVFPDRESRYAYDNFDVRVHERNTVRDGVLIHGQRTTAISADGLTIHKLYDLNHFGVLTAEDFAWALREAGFTNITLMGKELQPLTVSSKTIYVVAVKSDS